MARADLCHAVIGDPGELGRPVGPRDKLDRRQGESEDLLVAGKLLHHPQARFEIIKDGDIKPALDRAAIGRHLDHFVEVWARENMREDIQLHRFSLKVARAYDWRMGSVLMATPA